MEQQNQAFNSFLLDEIAVHLNVFGALMEDRVLCHMYGTLVITNNRNRLRNINRDISQQPSYPCEFIYKSAKVPVLNFGREKWNNRLLIWLIIRQTSNWFSSIWTSYPIRTSCDSAIMWSRANRPTSIVHFKYLNMCKATDIWGKRGACKNWFKCCTPKQILGLLWVRNKLSPNQTPILLRMWKQVPRVSFQLSI